MSEIPLPEQPKRSVFDSITGRRPQLRAAAAPPRKSAFPSIPLGVLEKLEELYPTADNLPSGLSFEALYRALGARSVVLTLRREYELQQEE